MGGGGGGAADIDLGVLGPGSSDLTVVGVRSGATRVPLAFPGDQFLASVNYCPPAPSNAAAAAAEARRR